MEKRRSPARSALAGAIERHKAAAAEKVAADAALHDFDELLSETRSAWSQASDAFDEAKSYYSDRLRMFGGSEQEVLREAAVRGLPAPRTVAEKAKHALEEAKKRLTLGTEGRETYEMRVIAAESALQTAASKLTEAVRAVEQEPLADLLAKAKEAHAEAYRSRSVLRHASSHLDGVTSNYNIVTDGLAPEIRRFLNTGVGDNDTVAIAPWEAAREALKTDPDAVLPE